MAEGEYHFQQLIGSQVFLKSGDLVGVVDEIVKLPGQDLLSVNKDGKEVLIPMVKQIIVSIDIKTKKIVVDPPEGLFDVAN
jgi:16S rRNA processing protein RimM